MARRSRASSIALAPVLFDASFEPMVTSKNPPPGQDILTASANNLYDGVTLADLDGFTERYELNARLVKTAAGLVEEVYRVGGRYDAAIRRIVGHLEDASPWRRRPAPRPCGRWSASTVAATRGSPRLRHRLGRRSRLAGRHD